MVPELPIIILRRYAHAIDAQLAKAKLDAYGIPCFLSNEELASYILCLTCKAWKLPYTFLK